MNNFGGLQYINTAYGVQGMRMHADTAQGAAGCPGQRPGPRWTPTGPLSGKLVSSLGAILVQSVRHPVVCCCMLLFGISRMFAYHSGSI